MNEYKGSQLRYLFESVLSSANSLTAKRNSNFSHFIKWDKIGDEKTRAHTDGVFYLEEKDTRTLIVYTDTPLWAAEFTMDKNIYMTRIAFEFGDSWIDELRFKPSSRVSKKKQYEAQQKKKEEYSLNSVELKETELNEIYSLINSVEDKKLKNQIFETMVTYYKWQKLEGLSD
ncbi:MAG: DciA family protein [Coriobacteriia bacterium]|nr:DciA family protein [Coriobacteriia bacterium]